ncbi:MAG: hypothetical protein IH991_23555 [Planctomycetes bacterium]|nr:hypothetical protein [Planctomycetota bacterium]
MRILVGWDDAQEAEISLCLSINDNVPEFFTNPKPFELAARGLPLEEALEKLFADSSDATKGHGRHDDTSVMLPEREWTMDSRLRRR